MVNNLRECPKEKKSYIHKVIQRMVEMRLKVVSRVGSSDKTRKTFSPRSKRFGGNHK